MIKQVCPTSCCHPTSSSHHSSTLRTVRLLASDPRIGGSVPPKTSPSGTSHRQDGVETETASSWRRRSPNLLCIPCKMACTPVAHRSIDRRQRRSNRTPHGDMEPSQGRTGMHLPHRISVVLLVSTRSLPRRCYCARTIYRKPLNDIHSTFVEEGIVPVAIPVFEEDPIKLIVIT